MTASVLRGKMVYINLTCEEETLSDFSNLPNPPAPAPPKFEDHPYVVAAGGVTAVWVWGVILVALLIGGALRLTDSGSSDSGPKPASVDCQRETMLRDQGFPYNKAILDAC